MARVTLIDGNNHPELSELIGKITGARGGNLINVYKLLLHSPAVTEAWLNFISTLRWKTDLDDQSTELAIMRVAILNRVDYILRQHAPNYAPKAGIIPAQIDALAEWRPSNQFSDKQRALLAYVDAMTKDVQVPDAVFRDLRAHYSERQAVELSVLVGAYNMHSRVISALDIDPEPAHAR